MSPRLQSAVHVSVTRGSAGARTGTPSLPLCEGQMSAGFAGHRTSSPKKDNLVSGPYVFTLQPVLETMIDKANLIYNRWSNGQELPTIVLKHITEDGTSDFDHPNSGQGANGEPMSPYGHQVQYPQQQQQYSQKPQTDSFVRSHRSLTQCIVEAHQRAKAIFPLRKPCQCSAKVAQSCPPSHSWSPLPNIGLQTSPVLPEITPAVHFARMSPSPAGFAMNGSPAPQGSGVHRGYSPLSNGHGHSNQKYGNATVFEGIYTNIVLPTDGPPVSMPPALSPTSKMAVVDTINFELGAMNSHNDQPWMAFF